MANGKNGFWLGLFSKVTDLGKINPVPGSFNYDINVTLYNNFH